MRIQSETAGPVEQTAAGSTIALGTTNEVSVMGTEDSRAMMNRHKMARGLVHILCTLALLFVGFAHKVPDVFGGLPPQELAAYTLPDGSLPELCLPSTDGNSHDHGAAPGAGCEACIISASIILPLPTDVAGQPPQQAGDDIRPVRYEAFYRQIYPPNAAPRAPPAGFVV